MKWFWNKKRTNETETDETEVEKVEDSLSPEAKAEKEEESLSPFEQNEKLILESFNDRPEESGEHEVTIHMDDGNKINYKTDDNGIAWILANQAQGTNVALKWANVNHHHHLAINMNKVAYIEFSTIKSKGGDANEEVA